MLPPIARRQRQLVELGVRQDTARSWSGAAEAAAIPTKALLRWDQRHGVPTVVPTKVVVIKLRIVPAEGGRHLRERPLALEDGFLV